MTTDAVTSKGGTAKMVAAHTKELCKLANNNAMPFLGYLLSMAQAEAEEIALSAPELEKEDT